MNKCFEYLIFTEYMLFAGGSRCWYAVAAFFVRSFRLFFCGNARAVQCLTSLGTTINEKCWAINQKSLKSEHTQLIHTIWLIWYALRWVHWMKCGCCWLLLMGQWSTVLPRNTKQIPFAWSHLRLFLWIFNDNYR